MIDYEVQRCTRQCAATGRQLEPGETFYSVLAVEGAQVARRDYAAEAWHGPPEDALGWWKSRMPERDAHKLRWAPNDVMLHLLEELESQGELRDMRYVLALLLARRRVARLEESEFDATGQEWLVVHCPKYDQIYKVRVAAPTPERVEEIQDELAKLLFADAK
jgi:hypothetical protein